MGDVPRDVCVAVVGEDGARGKVNRVALWVVHANKINNSKSFQILYRQDISLFRHVF